MKTEEKVKALNREQGMGFTVAGVRFHRARAFLGRVKVRGHYPAWVDLNERAVSVRTGEQICEATP